jgi:hypothetical protein
MTHRCDGVTLSEIRRANLLDAFLLAILKSMDNTEALRWAYAAGLVDGEGCVSISRHSPSKASPGLYRYYPVLTISMSDPEALRELSDLWGKPIRTRTARVRDQAGEYVSTMYRLDVCNSADFRRIVANLLPFLRVKHGQAELALTLAKGAMGHRNSLRIPAEVRAEWGRLWQQCRDLKTKNTRRAIAVDPAA